MKQQTQFKYRCLRATVKGGAVMSVLKGRAVLEFDERVAPIVVTLEDQNWGVHGFWACYDALKTVGLGEYALKHRAVLESALKGVGALVLPCA